MFVIDAIEMSGTYFRWKSGKDKQVLSRLMLFDNRLFEVPRQFGAASTMAIWRHWKFLCTSCPKPTP